MTAVTAHLTWQMITASTQSVRLASTYLEPGSSIAEAERESLKRKGNVRRERNVRRKKFKAFKDKIGLKASIRTEIIESEPFLSPAVQMFTVLHNDLVCTPLYLDKLTTNAARRLGRMYRRHLKVKVLP